MNFQLLTNVVFNQNKIFIVFDRPEIFLPPGQKIIDPQDPKTLADKVFSQVRPDKTRGARN
jgi:hypothetical protein